MERRSLLLWSGIAVLCIGIVIGAIIYLRAANTPNGEPGFLRTLTNSVVPSSGGKTGIPKLNDKIRPFTPIDQTPKEAPYVDGSAPPSQDLPSFSMSPDGRYTRNP